MKLPVRSVCIVVAWCSVSVTAAAAPCPPPVLNQLSRIVDGKIAFCEDPKLPCWLVDASTGAWERRAVPSQPSVTLTATGVTACAADGKDCVTVTGTFEASGGAIANDDRTRIAVWAGATADVYDTKSGKRVSRLAGWKSSMYSAKDAQIQQVRFVGAAVAVWQSETPVSSAARLFHPLTGKKIADIGKAKAEVEPWAVHVAGDRWAFAGFDPKVYVVNVTTGKLTKTIKLPGGQSGRQFPGKVADGRIAVIAEDVRLVDLGTGKVSELPPATTCRE